MTANLVRYEFRLAYIEIPGGLIRTEGLGKWVPKSILRVGDPFFVKTKCR
jgi:hypothetical protein